MPRPINGFTHARKQCGRFMPIIAELYRFLSEIFILFSVLNHHVKVKIQDPAAAMEVNKCRLR